MTRVSLIFLLQYIANSRPWEGLWGAVLGGPFDLVSRVSKVCYNRASRGY